jgi:phosphatidylserine/phosphatidylglycerophosphate/cardiolipin synthase-like enzyme
MVRVDDGGEISKILARATACRSTETRLEIATPFFDIDTANWELILRAKKAGVLVRIFTRWPEEVQNKRMLLDQQGRYFHVSLVAKLHAKAVLLVSRSGEQYGWVGSFNLTRASEQATYELGITFEGNGILESKLAQSLLAEFARWERAAKPVEDSFPSKSKRAFNFTDRRKK